MRTTTRLGLPAVAAALLGLIAVPMQGAGAPETLSYQGVLTDATTGVAVADGSYSVTFSIWEAPAGGTQALYTKTLDVGVVDGMYNVILSDPDSGQTLPEVFGSGTERYMEVTVGAGPPLSPRQQIASVPYAMIAGSVAPGQGVDPSTLYDRVQLEETVLATGTLTTITGQTSDGSASPMAVSVTVPPEGSWYIQVSWSSTTFLRVKQDGGDAGIVHSIEVSGGTTESWPAGNRWNEATADNNNDATHFGGGQRILMPPTNGATYTFTLQHRGSGTNWDADTRGDPDGSGHNGDLTLLEAIVLPLVTAQ